MEEFKLKDRSEYTPEMADEPALPVARKNRRRWIFVAIFLLAAGAALLLLVRHSEAWYRELVRAAQHRQETCHARLLKLIDTARSDASAVDRLERCAREAAEIYRLRLPEEDIRHYIRILRLLHRDREAFQEARNEKFVLDGVDYSTRCPFCRGGGKCVYCRGTGKCFECGGTGHVLLAGHNRQCPLCGGSALCGKCRGNPDAATCDRCGGIGVTLDRQKLMAKSRQLYRKLRLIRLTTMDRNDYLKSIRADWRRGLAKAVEKVRKRFRSSGSAAVQAPAKH